MDPPIGPLPLKLAASLEQDDSYHNGFFFPFYLYYFFNL